MFLLFRNHAAKTLYLLISIALLSAYKAAKEQKVAIRAAARNFGVPDSTLRDKLNGRKTLNATEGRPTVLTTEQEKMLANHCIYMASVGYGYAGWQVVNCANNMLGELGVERQTPLMVALYLLETPSQNKNGQTLKNGGQSEARLEHRQLNKSIFPEI